MLGRHVLNTALAVACGMLLLLAGWPAEAANWSNAQLLNDPSETSCKDPQIYPATGGGFHAVYKHAPSGAPWQIRYRRYNQGLGPRLNVPHTGWPGGFSDMIEALDGSIWVAWENWVGNDQGGEQIFAARSTNGGQSWTSYNVTNYVYTGDRGGEAKNPQLAPFGTGNSPSVVIAHWQAYEKQLKSNTWNGSAWSPVNPMNVGTDNFYAAKGICRSAYDGTVYRTYGRLINNVWQICYKRWDGVSWGPEVVVSTNTRTDFVARPAIAVNALNQIMVVWDQDNQVYWRMYDPATGWTPQGVIPDAYNASVTAIPGSPMFYVVYIPVNDQNYVHGRRFIYGQWDPPVVVSKGMSFGYTTTPEVIAEPNGRLWCAWESWPNGSPQMFFATTGDFMNQDTTPPVFNGPVIDDGDTQDIATFLRASWGAASDPESGIHHYEYSIGTAPGATNVSGWVNCGTSTSMAHSQVFSAGTYYINVRALNNAGLSSNVVSSNGIQIVVPANPRTFSAPVSVESSSRACSNAALSPANDGGLHLVYDITDPYVHYRKRGADGIWRPAQGVAPGAYPSVVETTNNVIRLVFTDQMARENMTLRESSNSGSGWSSPVNIFYAMNWYPRLARGLNGSVHLIDNFFVHNTHEVRFATRSTSSWSTTTALGTSNRWGTPDLASGSDGVIHTVWSTGTNLMYRRQVNGSWEAAQTLDSSPTCLLPRVALDSSNRPVIVWLGASALPGYEVKFTRWTGSGWTAPRVIGYGHFPAVAVDQNNHIHVVFTFPGVAGKEDIMHLVFNGSSWTAARNISNNAGISSRPAIAVTSDNSVHIAWQDDSNRALSQIFYAVSGGAPTAGAIQGTVRDSNGNPLSGATITTSPGGYTATTGSDGFYRLSNVAPGTYSVTAQKAGYSTQTQSNRNVVAGQTTVVDFTLSVIPGAISGVVRDSANNPISGVTVSTTPGGYTAFTNTSGQYTISNVPPGTYTVEAYKSGYGSVTQSNVQVVSNQTTTVNFTFSTGSGTITGTVRDSASNPLSGVTVRTVGASFSAVTNQSGQYTLSNVPAGTYTLEASKSGYVTQTQSNVQVVANQTTTVNFTLIANLGQITGTVRDGCNTPIGGATVRTTTGGYTATTAQDGSYTISNITSGTYTVEASKDGFITQTVVNVSVNAGQSTQVNFNLPVLVQSDVLVNGDFEGGYTSFWGGRIANGWGATFRNSESASNCAWLANNQGGTVGYTQRIYLDYQGGEAGIIQVVSGLTPGAQFRFSAWAYQSSPNSTCWIGADPNGGTTLPARQTAFINNPSRWNYQEVTGTVGPSGRVSVFLWVWHQWLPAGQCYFNDARLVVTAPGSPGRIRGFVREPNNTPVAGATVSTDFGGYTTTTGSDGSYTLLNVSPGTYNLTVSKQGYESQTQSVTVSGCQETVRDFVITEPLEKVQNGNMEGGFWSTGWSTACSGVPSVLPNPRGAWGWNNDPSVPFNTFSSTTIKRSGGYSLGMAFCQSAPSPGKLGVVWQTVYLGAPNASKTFTVYAYHTDGNCPSIMCWNPGISQPDPTVAAANGRFQWVTTDNWGQRNTWVGRSMTVTADSTGYVTIMFGGAAHPGTVPGARIYFDDISVR